jgi:lysophospholipase L1-like esterase
MTAYAAETDAGYLEMMEAADKSVYLFAGDSLTEGTYGESYVDRMATALAWAPGGTRPELVNAGLGCDTVLSLLDRIEEPLVRHRPAWVVLAIGSNDVWLPWLGSHSIGWWLWFRYRRIRWRQTPARDLDEFAAAYRALIDKARALSNARVLACTVSPLGERLSTPVNHQVARVNGTIKHVAVHAGVPVADVWQAFVEELAPLPRRSRYLPREWLTRWLDRQRLRGGSADALSRRRRLHLTFDGIHLNSRGADLWAATVLKALVES